VVLKLLRLVCGRNFEEFGEVGERKQESRLLEAILWGAQRTRMLVEMWTIKTVLADETSWGQRLY
jgi:hypothetical protein